ncbi:unnamed protein product [Ectocarpus sp. 6 AP-2014]
MTLALLSSKIAAESNGTKVDGRCYNSRSKNKTRWEMYNLQQLRQKQIRRRKRQGLVRGVYSKAEMVEYEEILRNERNATTPRAQNAKTS